MKKIILHIAIFLAVLVNVHSQAPYGDYVSMKLLDTQDTLIIKRQFGEFWFGGRGGINVNKYFGNVYVNEFEVGNPFNRTNNYENGTGNGYFVGLLFEWLPLGELWGTSLHINFWDKKNSSARTPYLGDSLNSFYEFTSEYNYIAISTEARYNLWLEGMHAFGGLDLNIPVTHIAYQEYKFQNPERIQYRKTINLEEVNFTLGLNLGIGYDFFVADMNDKARAKFSPFASVHLGSSMISDEGSSWSNLQFRFGFALKIGIDDMKYDTVYFDKNYKEPSVTFASVGHNPGITFPGFRPPSTFASANLKYVPLPEVVTPDISKQTLASSEISIPEKRRTQINTFLKKPSDTLRLNFATSTTVELSPSDLQVLDLVIDYLKKNPNFEVRILGHSDDAGTFDENDDRSRRRAVGVRQYFIDKGLPEKKVLAGWSGSTNAVAPNNTEAGRKQNRRVDLVIVR